MKKLLLTLALIICFTTVKAGGFGLSLGPKFGYQKIMLSNKETEINKNFNKNTTAKAENLTYTPKDNRKESALDKADRSWRARLDSNRAEVLTTIRDAMVQLGDLSRHTRSLIWNADDGLLLWDVSRKTPEGVTAGLCVSERGMEILNQYGRTLDDLDRPVLIKRPETKENYLSADDFNRVLEQFAKKDMIFDRIFFRDPFNCQDSADVLSYTLKELNESLKSKELKIVISQRIPCHGQRISDLISSQILNDSTRDAFDKILKKMELAENEFFGDKENKLFAFDEKTVEETFTKNGLEVKSASKVITEKRRLTPQEIERWLNADSSAYGSALNTAVGNEDMDKIKNLLITASQNKLFSWNTTIQFMTVQFNS